MFCANCGKEVDERAVFCMNCGVALKNTAYLNNKTTPSSLHRTMAGISVAFGVLSLVYMVVFGVFILLMIVYAPESALYIVIIPLIMSVIGFILSVYAANKDGGRGLPKTGIVLNTIVLTMIILILVYANL